MNDTVELIVWDFDGVLNANIVDGRFVWADTLYTDLGVDPVALSDFLFASGLIRQVVRGDLDLRETMAAWLEEEGHRIPVDTFLDYWFEKDALPDHEVVRLMDDHPARQVIGTNNETHRSAYIEGPMGFDQKVERLFSSGRMGVAKPDLGFFHQIADWADVRPARILLIDDNRPNIDAAESLGWQGFHFTPDTRNNLPAHLGLT